MGKQLLETPWSTVGYLTAKRTYARRIDADDLNSPTEEWHQIVDRVIQATDDQLHVGFSDDEKARLRNYSMSLKGTVAGRFLWQLGTKTVDRFGLFSLMNCAAVVVDEPIRPFTWAMDGLMLGSGIGFNIQREYVYKLPKVTEDFQVPVRHDFSDAFFILPDTREGWVKLLEYTLRSAFEKDFAKGFTFSTQLIRGKGAPIKGFGGVASGPEDLVWGINQIAKKLHSRRGKQLRPIDCLDIMNIIGSIVVSGNVRRSAQIAIGDFDDIQFLRAKKWSSGNIPNWRAMSNNSVICNDLSLLPQAFWDTYAGGSEPYGLINMKLSQSCGRVGDKRYKDKNAAAYNPCVVGETEVTMADGSTRTIMALTADFVSGAAEHSVQSVNLQTGKVEPKLLRFATQTEADAEIIELELEDGTVLKLTPNHLVFTSNRGYVEAASLTEDDDLVTTPEALNNDNGIAGIEHGAISKEAQSGSGNSNEDSWGKGERAPFLQVW